MDSVKRDSLLGKVRAQSPREQPHRNEPLPVVSLEDFFDGNDDYGSIGCNLLENEHPGPEGFYAVLKAVRSRLEVQDVLVEVYEVEDGQWPFSERVYVLTDASRDEVSRWVAPLHPDAVDEGFPWSRPTTPLSMLPSGVKVYAAWWD